MDALRSARKALQQVGLESDRVSLLAKGQTVKFIADTDCGKMLVEGDIVKDDAYPKDTRHLYTPRDHLSAKIANEEYVKRRFGLDRIVFHEGLAAEVDGVRFVIREYAKDTLLDGLASQVETDLSLVLQELLKMWSELPDDHHFIHVPYADEIFALCSHLASQDKIDRKEALWVKNYLAREHKKVALYDVPTLTHGVLNLDHIVDFHGPRLIDWAELKHRSAVCDLVRLQFHASLKAPAPVHAAVARTIYGFCSSHFAEYEDMLSVAVLRHSLSFWDSNSKCKIYQGEGLVDFYEHRHVELAGAVV